jgi:uncharacterized protein (TIGR03067 family)
MRRLATALLIAFLPLALAIARADDPAPTGDLAKLQGEWKTMIGPNKDRPVTFSIKGKAVAVKFTTGDGETLNLAGEIKVDESASPRTIDFVGFKHDGEAMDDSRGLYKVEGDTFTLCVAGPGEPRPAEFKAGSGDEPPHLWTFTRPK